MTEYGACLDPDCPAPAEIVDRDDWPSTHGPVPHAATHCAAGHRYYGPVS